MTKTLLPKPNEYILSKERAKKLLGDNRLTKRDGTISKIKLENNDGKVLSSNKLITSIGEELLSSLTAKNPTSSQKTISSTWELGASLPITKIAWLCSHLDTNYIGHLAEEVDALQSKIFDPDVSNLATHSFALGMLMSYTLSTGDCVIVKEKIPMTDKEAGAVQRILTGQNAVLAAVSQGYSLISCLANAIANGHLIEEDLDLLIYSQEVKEKVLASIEAAREKMEEYNRERMKTAN
jgi:hypothetical protein